MLCGSPLGASLNGTQVSILLVARSSRWTPAKPLFCAQTLPSTCENCGLTMFTCAASMFCSGGSGQNLKVSLRSEEHTSELQSHVNLVCRLLLEKKKKNKSSSYLKNKKKENKKQ